MTRRAEPARPYRWSTYGAGSASRWTARWRVAGPSLRIYGYTMSKHSLGAAQGSSGQDRERDAATCPRVNQYTTNNQCGHRVRPWHVVTAATIPSCSAAGPGHTSPAQLNRPISEYRLGEMSIQSCGQSVSAPRGTAGARLNAHTELRTKCQRSGRGKRCTKIGLI